MPYSPPWSKNWDSFSGFKSFPPCYTAGRHEGAHREAKVELMTEPGDRAVLLLQKVSELLRGQPLSARREALESLVETGEGVFAVRRLAGSGREAWAEVLERGLEGYVGKDPTSTYRAGGRTRQWLKSKVRQEGEFLVGGVVERTEGWSLLVGSVSGDQLVYRGLVHFDVGRKLADALKANGLVRSRSRFSAKITERAVTWLEPRLTASVTYTEILPQGRLRAGVFRGFVGSPSS